MEDIEERSRLLLGDFTILAEQVVEYPFVQDKYHQGCEGSIRIQAQEQRDVLES